VLCLVPFESFAVVVRSDIRACVLRQSFSSVLLLWFWPLLIPSLLNMVIIKSSLIGSRTGPSDLITEISKCPCGSSHRTAISMCWHDKSNNRKHKKCFLNVSVVITFLQCVTLVNFTNILCRISRSQ